MEYKNPMNPISIIDIDDIMDYAKSFFSNPSNHRGAKVTGVFDGTVSNNPLGFV